MAKGWLGKVALMGLAGAAAGIGVFFLASAMTDGIMVPASIGFLALLAVDLVLFLLFYSSLFEKDKEE